MLSSLSVSKSPAGRLRHWCSSRYLRISPLHREFRLPLLHSRKTVSKAVHRLSRWISLLTCSPAYAPFTPSKSGQRLPPTYYRGCWHVVSRGFLLCYRHYRHRGQQFTIRRPSSCTRRCCIRLAQPLSPATDRRFGGPLPRQLANQTRVHLSADCSFGISTMRLKYIMRY